MSISQQFCAFIRQHGSGVQQEVRLDHDTMAARVGVMEKLFEKFFYDFSMYKTHFAHKMDYQRYVLLRHNFLLVSGFFVLMTVPFPFKPPFPTMGLCPKGYEGTFVCEPDNHKALQMYKDWKVGKKPEPAAPVDSSSS